MTIRVLLADDQALLRGTFRMLFDSADDMETVGEASNGCEAVDLAHAQHPDVLLMDIRMPEMDGLAATRLISESEDLAGVKVLILTTFEDDEYVAEALRAGASGFLGKGARPEELLDAVRTVAGGEALLCPSAARALITRFLMQPEACPAAMHERLACLTPRERDVLALVAMGLSNDEIADRLFISPLTAKTHVNRAMTKLDARDRAQLVVIAYQCGLVSPAMEPSGPSTSV
ncbi:response regulator transcription factor [Streptomyces sp. NPDC005134]|uniref:response regulator transcription factor n=1 Tax=unclassified Streptomyces TaxID=2593676 RepID=UPI0022565A96|nr:MULTISPECIES: response regulator transcription factor [unclassified Streptomyces]WSA75304.1 response regulator transcription factor [Streptomyces sp. NBC_01799]WSF88545.1 response regulator transcription factor [Streptomyces sp. NBC_01744]MCX5314660.1 response regulator transcription factor [Streptomyces sp. NBC_00154]WSA66700.1 response regulator transcription factor [Streptomyces sp. NBC_01800]WSC35284.1 response regulator transcription factor [Streptomyces sp. NBC_01763]